MNTTHAVCHDTESLRMQRARTRLLLADTPDLAFLAGLCRIPFRIDESIPTACTDGTVVRWNPAYTATITDDEVLGLVIEELLHVGLLHVVTMKRFADHRRANIAADLAIMSILESVNVPVTDHTCLPGRAPYQAFPKLRSMEEYYDLLGQQEPEEARPAAGEIEPAGSQQESAGEPADIGEQIRSMVRQAALEVAGNMSATMRAAVDAATEPKVAWKRVVRRYRTHLVRAGANWNRPNRRLWSRGVYAPTRRTRKLGDVLCLVDCSGSMCDETIQQCVAELGAIFRETATRIHVWQHDTQVQAKDIWRAGQALPEFTRACCGGTDHVPVFEEIMRSNLRPQLIIGLSDLWSRFPTSWSRCPVIWLANRTVPEIQRPPFGRVLPVSM